MKDRLAASALAKVHQVERVGHLCEVIEDRLGVVATVFEEIVQSRSWHPRHDNKHSPAGHDNTSAVDGRSGEDLENGEETRVREQGREVLLLSSSAQIL